MKHILLPMLLFSLTAASAPIGSRLIVCGISSYDESVNKMGKSASQKVIEFGLRVTSVAPTQSVFNIKRFDGLISITQGTSFSYAAISDKNINSSRIAISDRADMVSGVILSLQPHPSQADKKRVLLGRFVSGSLQPLAIGSCAIVPVGAKLNKPLPFIELAPQ